MHSWAPIATSSWLPCSVLSHGLRSAAGGSLPTFQVPTRHLMGTVLAGASTRMIWAVI